MIPAAASTGSRLVVRAATSALVASALAVRETSSAATRELFLACARVYVLAEQTDLLLLERSGRRAEDLDEPLFELVPWDATRVHLLEEALIEAGRALKTLEDGSGRALRRAAHLYTTAWLAPREDDQVITLTGAGAAHLATARARQSGETGAMKMNAPVSRG